MTKFFIVGIQRSGTTLLSVMLENHPKIHLEEKSIVFRIISCFKSLYDILPHNLHYTENEVIRHIIKKNGKGNLSELINLKQLESCSDLRSLISLSIDQKLATEGLSVWGDKAPNLQYWLKDLLLYIPDAKIIHIVRDGRANAYSISNRSERNIILSAQEWVDRNIEGIVHQQMLGPDQYHLVHYEELLRNPEIALKGICRFLNLPFHTNMLQLSKGNPPEANSYVKNKIDLNKIDQYKEHLTKSTIKKIERIQGPLLNKLGYNLQHPEFANTYRSLSIRRRIWLNQLDQFKKIFFPRKTGMRARKIIKTNTPFKMRIYNFMYHFVYNVFSEQIHKSLFESAYFRNKFLDKNNNRK